MDCVEVRKEMSALLDGELTPEQRGAVEAHLSQCAECLRELEQLKRIDSAYRNLTPKTAPEGFERRVQRALKPDMVQFGSRRPVLRRLWPALAAAAVLVVVVGVVFVVQRRPATFDVALVRETGDKGVASQAVSPSAGIASKADSKGAGPKDASRALTDHLRASKAETVEQQTSAPAPLAKLDTRSRQESIGGSDGGGAGGEPKGGASPPSAYYAPERAMPKAVAAEPPEESGKAASEMVAGRGYSERRRSAGLGGRLRLGGMEELAKSFDEGIDEEQDDYFAAAETGTAPAEVEQIGVPGVKEKTAEGGGVSLDREQVVVGAPYAALPSASPASAPPPARAAEKSAETRMVGDRTFELRGDTWTQKEYQGEAVTTVTRGSESLSALFSKNAVVSDIVAIGDRVVFLLDGSWYRVEPAADKKP